MERHWERSRQEQKKVWKKKCQRIIRKESRRGKKKKNMHIFSPVALVSSSIKKTVYLWQSCLKAHWKIHSINVFQWNWQMALPSDSLHFWINLSALTLSLRLQIQKMRNVLCLPKICGRYCCCQLLLSLFLILWRCLGAHTFSAASK